MFTLNGGSNFGVSSAALGGLGGQQTIPGQAITNGVSLNDNALNFANASNNIGSLLGSVGVFQSPESLLGVSKILAPGGVDLGDSNTNFTANLLSQTNFYTLNSGQSQTQQVLGQLGNTLKNGGASTPLTININDFKQVNGQPDPSALSNAQAVLGTSSLKGNFFFDPTSNNKITGRTPVQANPLAGLLGGIGGTFAGTGSSAALGGLGTSALALLGQGGGVQAGGGTGLAGLTGVPQQGTGVNTALLSQILVPLLQSLASGQQGAVLPQQQVAQRSISPSSASAVTMPPNSAGLAVLLMLVALTGGMNPRQAA